MMGSGMLMVVCSTALVAQPATNGEALLPAEPSGIAEPAPLSGKGGPAPLSAVFDRGFTLRTADGETDLKLGASVQLDSRFYFGDSTAPDSFDIRRARLDFNSNLFGFMKVRIQAALEDTPYIRNAYLDLGPSDSVRLRLGQMKVPFSTQWLTLDNQVNFLERGSAEPLYPFFDRGVMLWGTVLAGTVSYSAGVYTGVGVDLDATKGDNDSAKLFAYRLFLRPFAPIASPYLNGLYLVGQGTSEMGGAPTRRFETRGMMAADFESQVWRWRTEQTLGTNGRNTDQITGRIDRRQRWGAEAHYLLGSFTASAEWLHIGYDDLRLLHELWSGSRLLRREELSRRDGEIQSLSIWASYFLTGEQKKLDTHGWRQPTPIHPWTDAQRGWGTWEVLGRFSRTVSSTSLFASERVNGYAAADFSSPVVAVGEGMSVNATVLDGAPLLYEGTVGLNWTMNHHFRIQVDGTYLWAPRFDEQAGTGGLVSAGNSDSAKALSKYRQLEREWSVGARFIVRI